MENLTPITQGIAILIIIAISLWFSKALFKRPATIDQQFFKVFHKAFIQWYETKYDIKRYGKAALTDLDIMDLHLIHSDQVLDTYFNIISSTNIHQLEMILIGITGKEYRYDVLSHILNIAEHLTSEKH